MANTVVDPLWAEKYRPQKISECILPDHLIDRFQQIVKDGALPNMLFSGTQGLGKTTVAKALCNELDLDFIFINASEEGNIDTLRGKIRKFATTISLHGGHKVVILDEADYLNAQSTQPALRGFIEDFSDNCRFILTCNYKNRIIKELHSRCPVIEFNTTKKDLVGLCGVFYQRLKEILNKENVQYEEEQVIELIKKFAPDWRRCISECQGNTVNGVLSIRNSSNMSGDIDELFNHLKAKDFKKMRRWVVENIDVDATAIFRAVFDRMYDKVAPESIPHLVIILAEYQYKQAFVADTEVNVVACMTEIMANVEIK